MNSYYFDLTPFLSRHSRFPKDDQLGSWTFVIDGESLTVFGAFAEACAQAKLYARIADSPSNLIVLENGAFFVRVHSRVG